MLLSRTLTLLSLIFVIELHGLLAIFLRFDKKHTIPQQYSFIWAFIDGYDAVYYSPPKSPAGLQFDFIVLRAMKALGHNVALSCSPNRTVNLPLSRY